MNGRLRAVVPWLVLVSPLAAQSRPRFGYEHLRRVVSVAALDRSPDGRQVGFPVSRPNYTVNRTETSLWLSRVAPGSGRARPGRRRSLPPARSPTGGVREDVGMSPGARVARNG